MMNLAAFSIQFAEKDYYLEIYADPFNKRIRIDDYRGRTHSVVGKAEQLVKQYDAEKLIIKVRSEDIYTFFESGFHPEAIVEGYFLGSDAYFFSKYYVAERKKSDHWIAGDSIIQIVYQLNPALDKVPPPKEYELKKLDTQFALQLSALYQKVFPIYPTPLHDPEYVKKTMNEGTIYYGFIYQGSIVSAASAETNLFYKNAELTDCATLPEHRKYGLMKLILQKLEEELRSAGIFCAYSLARSLSFGMNAVLFQLGYQYRGRMMNNCYIFDKLENMNMWVKNLANC